jgi:hypothetical protein
MAVYPLNTYKNGFILYPQKSSYSEEYAERMCRWYLTDHIVKDEHGKLFSRYRLHSNKPRTFTDYMAYDIICPVCHQRMQPIQEAISYHDLALYACRKCDNE